MCVKGMGVPRQCSPHQRWQADSSDFCSCCVPASPGHWHVCFQLVLAWVTNHSRQAFIHFHVFKLILFCLSGPSPQGRCKPLPVSFPRSLSRLHSVYAVGASTFNSSLGCTVLHCLLTCLPTAALALFPSTAHTALRAIFSKCKSAIIPPPSLA